MSNIKIARISSLPYRGEIVDIIQSDQHVVLALQHSEGQNLGLNVLSVKNFELSIAAEIASPHPIQKLVNLELKGGTLDRNFAVDVHGNLYQLPDLYYAKSSLVPIDIDGKIQRIEAYSKSELLLIVSSNDVESAVLFNVDQKTETWRQALLEPSDPSAEEEDAAGSSEARLVTAIAVHQPTGRFAIGFSDGLYAHYAPDGSSFKEYPIYDSHKKVRTSLHEQEVVALHYAIDQDQKLRLISAGADLTMTQMLVQEGIPHVKGDAGGHEKNVVRLFQGQGQYFYSISYDNTLRMWSVKDNYAPSEIDLQIVRPSGTLAPVCVGRISVKDNRGVWHEKPYLIYGGQNPKSSAGSLGFYPIVEDSFEGEDAKVHSIANKKKQGKVESRAVHRCLGAITWAEFEMESEIVQRRSEIIEEVGTWKDSPAVAFFQNTIKKEPSSELVQRARQLLFETGHPKLPRILEDFLGHENIAIGLQSLDYLRELHGSTSLYPLDLVFKNLKQADPSITTALNDFYQYKIRKGSQKIPYIRQRKAIETWKKALEFNIPAAFFLVAKSYEVGAGVPKNQKTADEYYKAGTEVNQPFCLSNYANALDRKKKDKEAIAYWKRAAPFDVASALYNLGLAYEGKRSIKKDKAEAIRWFKKAMTAAKKKGRDDIYRLAHKRYKKLDYWGANSFYNRTRNNKPEKIAPPEAAPLQSFAVELRQKALRCYAEIARQSDADSSLYQRAFEKIYSALLDEEDSIREVAFEMLLSGDDPLMLNVRGIMYALSNPDESIQIRSLELLYYSNMLRNPDTAEDAADLLRQIRESNNDALRYKAFLLSLTMEDGVLTYLRSLDKDVHTKIIDYERAAEKAKLDQQQKQLEQSIIDAFEAAQASVQPVETAGEGAEDGQETADQEPRSIDMATAETLFAQLQVERNWPYLKVRTVEYCLKNFT
ncbi:MAG: hypothetical protein VX278_23465, partial [Myxococcota bacterium]|nr:hypothetical protein [Myxococcota bacterium]